MCVIKQLRQPRIHLTDTLNIAVFDTVGTVSIALSLAYYMEWCPVKTVAGAFLLGHVSHSAFRVNTPMTDAIKHNTGTQN